MPDVMLSLLVVKKSHVGFDYFSCTATRDLATSRSRLVTGIPRLQMRQVEVFNDESLGVAQLLSLVDQTLCFFLMLFKCHFLIVSLDKLFIETLLNISVLHA